MAVRTNDAAVGLIIEVDATISLTPFIETASALVDEFCDVTPAVHDATRLELIERWLAAHFYSVRDPRAASESAGPVASTFMHKVGMYINQTTHGQQALMLDTSGALASWNQDMQNGVYLGSFDVQFVGDQSNAEPLE
jgi:hypothetical protein